MDSDWQSTHSSPLSLGTQRLLRTLFHVSRDKLLANFSFPFLFLFIGKNATRKKKLAETHRQFLHAPALARLGRSAAMEDMTQGMEKLSMSGGTLCKTHVVFNGRYTVSLRRQSRSLGCCSVSRKVWPEVRGAAQEADSAEASADALSEEFQRPKQTSLPNRWILYASGV